MVLRHAVQQICKKALIEARKIEQAFTQQLAERKNARPAYPRYNSGYPQQAYSLHYEGICSHLSIEDFSRVDAMIALRMRANGHSPNAVFSAIRECAPTIRTEREKRRNWSAYAERTVNYAFGVAGDRDLIKYGKYMGTWQRIENLTQAAFHTEASEQTSYQTQSFRRLY